MKQVGWEENNVMDALSKLALSGSVKDEIIRERRITSFLKEVEASELGVDEWLEWMASTIKYLESGNVSQGIQEANQTKRLNSNYMVQNSATT